MKLIDLIKDVSINANRITISVLEEDTKDVDTFIPKVILNKVNNEYQNKEKLKDFYEYNINTLYVDNYKRLSIRLTPPFKK
jgi:hypothetical protein